MDRTIRQEYINTELDHGKYNVFNIIKLPPRRGEFGNARRIRLVTYIELLELPGLRP